MEKTQCGPSAFLEPSREEVMTILKRLVIAWDSGDPLEFDVEMRKARLAIGFKKFKREGRP